MTATGLPDDTAIYNDELALLEKKGENKWFSAPWLFAECVSRGRGQIDSHPDSVRLTHPRRPPVPVPPPPRAVRRLKALGSL